jgi:hypothetical protein
MFNDQHRIESSDVNTLLVLEAEGRVGRAMVAMAIQSHLPVIAVSLDPAALRLLKLQNPEADLEVLVGSVIDVRSAVWLADDLRNLRRKISGLIAPIEATEAGADLQCRRSDALDVLRSQMRWSAAAPSQGLDADLLR